MNFVYNEVTKCQKMYGKLLPINFGYTVYLVHFFLPSDFVKFLARVKCEGSNHEMKTKFYMLKCRNYLLLTKKLDITFRKWYALRNFIWEIANLPTCVQKFLFSHWRHQIKFLLHQFAQLASILEAEPKTTAKANAMRKWRKNVKNSASTFWQRRASRINWSADMYK